jgi:hypothetical protein
MEFLTVILWLGIVWIAGVCCWSWWKGTSALEPFTLPPRATPSKPAWIRTPLDGIARKGHSCRVLDSFADPEFPTSTIEIVESSCEEGLPHTSDPNTIRIPESVWNQGSRRANVLRHERVHLLQKRNPSAWSDFYKIWNYTIHSQLPDGFPDATAVRGNPDTDPPFACWAGRYWFVPLYTNRQAPRLGDADVRVWDARRKEWTNPPATWNALFCQEGRCPHQWEHPAEIAAEYWTNIDTWKTPASVALRNFILTQK